MTPTATPINHVWRWKKSSKSAWLLMKQSQALNSSLKKSPYRSIWSLRWLIGELTVTKMPKWIIYKQHFPLRFHRWADLIRNWKGAVFNEGFLDQSKKGTIMNTLWPILREESLKKSSLNRLKKNHHVEHFRIHLWSFKEKKSLFWLISSPFALNRRRTKCF